MRIIRVQDLRIVVDRSFAVDDKSGAWECLSLSPLNMTKQLEALVKVKQKRHLRLVFKDQEAIDRLLNTKSEGLKDLQEFIRFVRKYLNVFVMTRSEFMKMIKLTGTVTPAVASDWVVALKETKVATNEKNVGLLWTGNLLEIYGLARTFALLPDTYYRATFELALQYTQQRLNDLFDRQFVPEILESAQQINRNCRLAEAEALVIPPLGTETSPYITWGSFAHSFQVPVGLVEYLETPRVVRQKQWPMQPTKGVPIDVLAAMS